MKRKQELCALPSRVESTSGEGCDLQEMGEKEKKRFYDGLVMHLKRQMGEYFARYPEEWDKLR
ncbi:MAG: hypothetical protein KH452_06135 [Clostridiales bacterium]|nr:hypothetical protein [Clostridiales bacterium]